MTNDGSYIIIENAAIYTYSYHIYLIYSLLHAKMTGKRKTQSHETKEQMSYDQLVEDDREFEPCLISMRQHIKRNAIRNDDRPVVNVDHQKYRLLTSNENLILEHLALSSPQENTKKTTSPLGFQFPFSSGELDFSSYVGSTGSSNRHTFEQIRTGGITSQSNNPLQQLHVHGKGKTKPAKSGSLRDYSNSETARSNSQISPISHGNFLFSIFVSGS